MLDRDFVYLAVDLAHLLCDELRHSNAEQETAASPGACKADTRSYKCDRRCVAKMRIQ